jgi:hypothetical protein
MSPPPPRGRLTGGRTKKSKSRRKKPSRRSRSAGGGFNKPGRGRALGSVGGALSKKRAQFRRFKVDLNHLARAKSKSARASYLDKCTRTPGLIAFTQSGCADLARNLEFCSSKTRNYLSKNKAKLTRAKSSKQAAKSLMLRGGSVFAHIIQGISDIFSGNWL